MLASGLLGPSRSSRTSEQGHGNKTKFLPYYSNIFHLYLKKILWRCQQKWQSTEFQKPSPPQQWINWQKKKKKIQINRNSGNCQSLQQTKECLIKEKTSKPWQLRNCHQVTNWSLSQQNGDFSGHALQRTDFTKFQKPKKCHLQHRATADPEDCDHHHSRI